MAQFNHKAPGDLKRNYAIRVFGTQDRTYFPLPGGQNCVQHDYLLGCGMIPTQNDERYKVVVKHDVKGVLHTESFKTFEQALDYLKDSWAHLNIDRHLIQISCSAAIYDRHDSGSRVFLIGQPYLTDVRLRH